MDPTLLFETKGISVHLQVMRAMVIACAFLAAAALSYGIASSPTRIANRLGLRGLKRQRVLSQNELWAGIEPLVRWLGVRCSGILTEEQRSELERQIGLAGDYLGITADEYLALTLVSGVGGALVGAFAGYVLDMGGLVLVMGLMLGLAAPYFQISGVAQERLKNVSRGLPYVIDLMALSMGAGLDFPGSVRQVVEKSSNPDDPLVEEFTLILQTMSLGRTRREALTEFARRAPIETVTEFTNSLIQAEDRGNPVAEVLAIQATVSRTRRSVRAEELAAKASVQMVGPLMLVFFCIMGLLMGPAFMNIMAGL
jgi:tight adherence protein C